MSGPPWLQIRLGSTPTSRLQQEHRIALSAQIARLRGSLGRYIEGQERGHAYLVAGHRGAGKTTLVQATVEQLSHPTAAEGSQRLPLVVPLSGPALLELAAHPDTTPEGLRQQLCVHLTDALTSAVNQEFLRQLQVQAAARPAQAGRLMLLRLRLESGPTLSEVLELWRPEAPDGPPPGLSPAAARQVEVFWKNLQLQQIISGTRESTFAAAQGDSVSLDASVRADGTLERVVPSLWSLLAGGAASLGLLAAGGTLPEATGVGVIAALLAATTLSLTAARRRTADRRSDVSYRPDHTVAALPRLLPELVDQLWDVGIAPVFLVDELDQAEAQRGPTAALLRAVRALVGERSATFFLVSRAYFELLEASSQRAAYPPESASVSARIYVSYLPAEVEAYLHRVLVLADDAGADAILARDVLIKGLLQQTRLHFSSLRRALEQLSLELSQPEPPEAILRAPQRQAALLHQLAVEQILARPAILRRIQADRYFAQLMLDVLYMPGVLWARGEALAADRAQVAAWLCPVCVAPLPEAADIPPGSVVSPLDLDLLAETLAGLVRLLCAPSLLGGGRWPLPARPLLVPLHTAPGQYGWLCAPDGRPLSPVGEAPLRALEAILAQHGGAPSVAALLDGYLPAGGDALRQARSALAAAAEAGEGGDEAVVRGALEAWHDALLGLDRCAEGLQVALGLAAVLVALSDTPGEDTDLASAWALVGRLPPAEHRPLLSGLLVVAGGEVDAALPVAWAALPDVLARLRAGMVPVAAAARVGLEAQAWRRLWVQRARLQRGEALLPPAAADVLAAWWGRPVGALLLGGGLAALTAEDWARWEAQAPPDAG